MPPRGSKPKPLARHRRERTFRRDRHERSLPFADGQHPRQPDGLFPDAVTAWSEIVAELRQLGILDSADAMLLEAAAVCTGRLRQARALVAEEGLTTRGDRGAVVNPLVRIELSSIAQLRQILSELGLSPTSRARLGLGEEAALPFADLGPSPRSGATGGVQNPVNRRQGRSAEKPGRVMRG
jgi:P27 family predicted phage terminase small subunit